MIKHWLARLSIILGVSLFAGVAIAQLYGNFPKVGGAAYCITYVNAVCQQTVPAGPTIVTGSETIAADTNLASGRMPQTVKMGLASLNALPVAFEAITNGSAYYTYTFGNSTGGLVFVAANTISDARVTAPPAPIDGQQVYISSSHTITAFQFIANTGQTLAVTTPTVLTASATVPQGYKFVYRSSDAKWYKLQ